MNTLKLVVAGSALALGLAGVMPAASAATAFTFSDPADSNSSLGTGGFKFSPIQDIYVTALGYYDGGYPQNPFPHDVGIYDFNSQQLVTPVVSVGATDSLVDNFRFKTIAPVALSYGTTYILAGLDLASSGNTNKYFSSGYTGTVSPLITYSAYVINGNSFLSFPTDYTYETRPFFGANMIVTAVPETEAYVMFLVGLGLVGSIARRRKQNAA